MSADSQDEEKASLAPLQRGHESSPALRTTSLKKKKGPLLCLPANARENNVVPTVLTTPWEHNFQRSTKLLLDPEEPRKRVFRLGIHGGVAPLLGLCAHLSTQAQGKNGVRPHFMALSLTHLQ
jgi:hypothetical protein